MMTEEQARSIIDGVINSLGDHLRETNARSILEAARCNTTGGYVQSAVVKINDSETYVFNFVIGYKVMR